MRGPGYRVGVDANYIWELTDGDLEREIWEVDGTVQGLYPLLAERGVDLLRVRLWTSEVGPASLDVATHVAGAGQRAGLEPLLVIFCSDEWADMNKAPLPKRWKGVSPEERPGVVEGYAAEVTRHFEARDIGVPTYAVGNEVDFGFAGLFATEEHEAYQRLMAEGRVPGFGGRDQAPTKKASALLDRLATEVWPQEAELLAACARGVRSADPDARILVHLAMGWEPVFCERFFDVVVGAGVPVDVVGLSYYPAVLGDLAYSLTLESIERLSSRFGVSVLLSECGYPSEPPEGIFSFMRRPMSRFPLTLDGQREWLFDLLQWTFEHPDVEGTVYWSPEFSTHRDIWQAQALFDDAGRAKPALGAFDAFNNWRVRQKGTKR